MFEGINIIAVLGTTCFMLASATVWYSPLLFGNVWLRELGVTAEAIEASRQNVYRYLGIVGFGYALAVVLLSIAVTAITALGTPPLWVAASIGGVTALLVGTTVMWENRSWRYFLINAGFYLYFVIVGILMLTYWPW